MSIEEKQNFPTYQDFNSIEYPLNEKEISSLIKKFYKSTISVELIGSGSKKKIGRALQCDKTLSTSKLNGIVEYLPEELYIKVRAGTPIQYIEEELKKNLEINFKSQFEKVLNFVKVNKTLNLIGCYSNNKDSSSP